MQHIAVFLIKILSFLPFGFLKILAFKWYWINTIVRYRKTVVENNLKLAFPNKSVRERKNIRKRFFKHFFNIVIEIIQLMRARKSFLQNHIKLKNPELLENFIKQKKSVILLSGHYNNWEWMGAKIALSFTTPFIAIYKKLNSEAFNNLLIKIRERFGGKVVSMKDSIRYFLNNKNECQIIGIIADQNPVVRNSTDWLPFFDKEVPVFMGAEKLAKKMNTPIIFCNMQKLDNHKYIISFELLEENPKEIPEGEITKKYFKRLEQQISKEPSQWLWSHRRWKHKKQQ